MGKDRAVVLDVRNVPSSRETPAPANGEAVLMSALVMLHVCLASCSSQIRALALPALLSLLVDPILSLVDTAYVGRGLGAISLAALGTAVLKQ